VTPIYPNLQISTGAMASAHAALRRRFGAALLAASAMAAVASGIGYYAQRDATALWQPVDGVVANRSIESRSGTGKSGDSYFIRDRYSAYWRGGSIQCHWDDPLSSGVRGWVERWRLERGALWPVAAPIRLRIDPLQLDRCQPADAWQRVIRPRLLVAVSVAALLLLAGTWLRRGTDSRG
jgi:hypothetical protein